MIDIDGWMGRYERAWRTDRPADVAALFTEDAVYLTAPWDDPIVGRDGIVAWWIAESEPSRPSFEWWPVAVTDTTAVIEGRTVYPGASSYFNLWVIRFGAAGRACSFTEWWMVEG